MDEYSKNFYLMVIAVGSIGFFIIGRIWFPPVEEEESYIDPRTAAYMASCDARGLFYLREANACVDKVGVLHEVIITGSGLVIDE